MGAPRPGGQDRRVKLAIIGGGGVRVPLLINGLVSRGLPIHRIALFDPDAERLATISAVARRRTPGIEISVHRVISECLGEADFVVTSIRVGGLAARRHDEALSLAHGIVGQETVGPAGFAMAVRSVLPLVRYAEEIARHAPAAWVINFSNPVGIVTQAMRGAADVKIVGICDTPTELFAEVAHALSVPFHECRFDYLGLNHLGWIREVYRNEQPLLRMLWTDRARLETLYSRPLFSAAHLAALRLLPTEYVFYYDFPERAVANLRAAGKGRGDVVSDLTDRLFRDLADAARDPVQIYEEYVTARSASYMQIESGQAVPSQPSPWAALTGYDRIAFDVMHALIHDSQAVIPLNVRNEGNIPELRPDDIVEVPCVVGRDGPRAHHVGALPRQVRELVVRVKEYERKTIAAAVTMERDALIDALAHHPLVPSHAVASTLVDGLRL